MFAYCLNNPVNRVDPDGMDAIILFDERYYGHNGMLVQDEEGKWWHYYWGAALGKPKELAEYLLPVPAISSCEPYEGELDLDSLKNGTSYKGYTDMLYLEGDFSKSAETIKNEQGGIFHVFFNNCSEKTLSILAESATEYQFELLDARLLISPKWAFNHMKAAVTES